MQPLQVIFGIIIGLFVLMALVVAHEFGHFIMARRNGVRVKEFGIGFPPRAIAWVKKEVEVKDPTTGKTIKQQKWVKIPRSDWEAPQDSLIFSLNFLPIGGFCAMDGESDADTRKGTFGATTFIGKTKILFGGVAMNWLVAFVLLTILAFTGMPQFLDNQFYLGQDAVITGQGVPVQDVVADSPAAKAGFQRDDVIIRIEDQPVSAPQEITDYGTAHPGETVTYYIERNHEELPLVATLNPEGSEYALGVQMGYGQVLIRSTWSAPVVGAGLTIQMTAETFKGLGMMVWNVVSGVFRQFSSDANVRAEGQAAIGAAGDSVSGPVGIIGVIFPAFAKSGLTNLIFLAALISISLACMNVLPIPALDGGRWLLIFIFRLLRRPLTKETEEGIVSRAFMVLIGLIVVITVLDIIKLF